MDLIDAGQGELTVVFVERKADAHDLAQFLVREKYNARAIHGDLSQQVRTYNLENFK